MISLSLLTKVFPKARPRRTTKGGRSWWYSPSSKDEEDLSLLIANQMRKKRVPKQRGRLKVSLSIGYARKKPGDIDNIEKLILDACNGILWEDKDIYELHTKIFERCNDYLIIEIEKEVAR